jgi:hypothetical protein
MDKYEKRLLERLHESGAQLVRSRRHRKWRLSSGIVFVQPSTPSDWRNSRNQLSIFNRLLDSHAPATISFKRSVDLVDEAASPEVRFRTANNPTHERANVVVPKLSPSPQQEPKVVWQFKDINGVLTAVDNVQEYWELDCCGRVRVLMKLASRFARRIEILTAFAVVAPVEELNLDPPSPYITDHSEEAKRKREQEHIKRTHREWGGTASVGETWCNDMIGLPCLRLEDPRVGEVVIETSASGLLLATEETMAFGELNFANHHARACLPQWENYELSVSQQPTACPYPFPDKGYLSYLFVDRAGMKNRNITYKTCDNWVNPMHSRKVIQRIYDYCSSSEQFSETNI